ncbi:MAG: DUF2378 family protein [Myxococcota bacterium]
MTHERVEFEQVAEGLLKGALEAHLDPQLVERLRAAGLDLTRKLAPAYPAAQFYKWLLIVSRHRFPGMSDEEASREVGRLAVMRGMQSTLIGRAALTAMQLLGVRRSLKRLGSSFKHGNNYIEAKVTELGPTSMEIQLGPLVGPPGYYEGVLEEGPRQVGARTVQLTRLRVDGEHLVWRVDWTE